jgi:SAM-dependent methyltransferase
MAGNSDASSGPNAAQSEYWNGPETRHWVTEDRFDRMLVPFATALIDAAAIAPDARVLDIGCGTGPTTCEAGRVATQGHAHGRDISHPMIEAARVRATGQGLANVTFEVGDAQTDPFRPEFDIVMSRFGVMFFEDPVAAFANLRTAIAPGGRLVFVCWQDLLANEWMALPAVTATQHVPLPELGPAGAPGPFSLGGADRIREVLAGAGYSEITIEPFETPMLIGGGCSCEEAVDFLRETGMGRALFAEAAPDAVERAVDAIITALQPHVTPDGVQLDAATWMVSATL